MTMRPSLALTALLILSTACSEQENNQKESKNVIVEIPPPMLSREEDGHLGSSSIIANDTMSNNGSSKNQSPEFLVSKTDAASVEIISKAGHNCARVISTRDVGESVIATCDDGKSYRIAVVNGHDLAMKCSVVRALGTDGGC